MKEYSTDSIRNIALVSHSSAGKTMMTEAFLHFTGATTRLGKIEDGTTVSDFDDEEKRRTISLYSTVIPIEYKDKKINVLDTPGYNDFIGEVVSALSVSDGACVLLDSVSGREVGTEIAWKYVNKFNLPRIVVVNKMNRENADFKKAMASLADYTDMRLIQVQIPWGEKLDFRGVIDILTMKAYDGAENKIVDIPAEYMEEAQQLRAALTEAAAESDEELMEKFFESMELSDEEILRGFSKAVKKGDFVPVYCAAGGQEIGVAPILDAFINLMPSPAERKPIVVKDKKGNDVEISCDDSGPLVAYVWKTTADPFVGKQTFLRVYSGMLTSDSRIWNGTRSVEERYGNLNIPMGKDNIPVKTVHAGDICSVAKLSETVTGDTFSDKANPLTVPVPEYPHALYRVAVYPKTQADSTKISPTLTRLCEEDMTLSWYNEMATNQTILQGMGDQHIDVAIRRAESKFMVNLLTKEPRVPYQETIVKEASAMYRHKKQSGGSGQFGEVHLKVKPNPDAEFEMHNDVFGGAISASYMPAIEKGIRNAMKEGILAGFPIHGIYVSVFDGKEHPVDSKPIAFETAGREAFKLAFADAGPVLEEPIYTVKITVPEEYMGDVMGDLNTRRARILGMETEKGESTVTALVPLAEMQRYTTQLRSMTGGRGVFTMEFSNYEVVPPHITQEIIANREKEKKEAEK
ncbi:MAG TPA: elongation factor G [Flexilinea sp.]|jgi:elongation factor G|nr:MAG: Elongation factor G [Chloroflexi bacterium ADurb.Bin344]HOG22568.1 elongation factor G [Flexilinea sp.]HOR56537.1 elongation factor G [Flexilinea sp.]HOU19680.1 elongation factor G [Flexilinea sp.]HPB39587.1 elongation factor G [Flexilinea sp.]